MNLDFTFTDPIEQAKEKPRTIEELTKLYNEAPEALKGRYLAKIREGADKLQCNVHGTLMGLKKGDSVQIPRTVKYHTLAAAVSRARKKGRFLTVDYKNYLVSYEI